MWVISLIIRRIDSQYFVNADFRVFIKGSINNNPRPSASVKKRFKQCHLSGNQIKPFYFLVICWLYIFRAIDYQRIFSRSRIFVSNVAMAHVLKCEGFSLLVKGPILLLNLIWQFRQCCCVFRRRLSELLITRTWMYEKLSQPTYTVNQGKNS